MSVSKKIGGAVTRNKVKRRLRHAFAACRSGLRDDVDLVIVARKGSATADYQIMEDEIKALMARLRLGGPDRTGA